MVTRSKVGTTKPTNRFTLHASTLSPIPKSHIQAFHNPHWQNAMQDEFNALIKNDTYKARLVANGKSQQLGIDCDETFSPVVKPATIRTVLSLAVSHQWPIHHLDVKNVFLHGELSETVYMHQPPGFTDPAHPDYVCHLQRSLYGLKQAPRAWFQRFASYAVRFGFYHSKTDTSLFIFRRGSDTAYLLLYVDDIILTASSSDVLQHIISSLHGEFAMTDLGQLNYFLGIAATRTSNGIFLSQSKYAREILERAKMLNCNPCRTHVGTEKKLGPEGPPVAADPTHYRCLATRLSTSGYCVFLGANLLSWSSKRQETLSRSSAEAEYRGVANAVAETSWVRNLLCELHTPISTATLVYCDNISAVYMSANPVQQQRTKHIEIDTHFVRDKVAAGHVRILHVPSRFQYADIFTKGTSLPAVCRF
ncbi:ribonuclease H-like domain-containing protein [Tanacetum coccineum]